VDSDKSPEMLSLAKDAPADVKAGVINLVVQGKPCRINGVTDVGSLLNSLGENSLYVNVRVNDEVLDRRDFNNIPIREGDRIDFLYFMGGGLFVQPDRRRN
jgi:sulfur carrier protein